MADPDGVLPAEVLEQGEHVLDEMSLP
jgi:hypothetical protein